MDKEIGLPPLPLTEIVVECIEGADGFLTAGKSYVYLGIEDFGGRAIIKEDDTGKAGHYRLDRFVRRGKTLKGKRKNDSLLRFWEECVSRREEQLRQHEETVTIIGHNGSERALIAEQGRWVNEARFKLHHAQRVLASLKDSSNG